MFHVGQKVVCVDADWFGEPDLPLRLLDFVKEVPLLHRVYRIRAVKWDEIVSEHYLYLAEIVNPVSDAGEVYWRARHFRPAVESDISVFTAMLKDERAKVPA